MHREYWIGDTKSLLHVHFVEAEGIEKRGDAGAGVLTGLVEDAVGESGLSDLLFRGGTRLRLKVGIGKDEEPSGAREDPGAAVIDAGSENLRWRQMNLDRIAIYVDVGRLELAEVDAGDHFAVRDEENLVADQKAWDVRAVAVPFDSLIE